VSPNEASPGARHDALEAGLPARRLYGRSKGKTLRAHQTELMEGLLPALSCDLSAPFRSAAHLFGQPIRDVWLEIGFGGGEHLVKAAQANCDVGLLGCEPFVNGMAKLLAQIERRGLTNVRLHLGDAIEAIDWLPDASLGRVFLLYPDPWPKRRHRKRRFVAPDTLAKLARVMKRGAELRFATDIDDYAGWTLSRIAQSPDFVWRDKRANDWLAPWDDWTATKYEIKAMAAGRKPVYLTFIRS
jgi:tRNA (guanine-N7-)-methyltransferase